MLSCVHLAAKNYRLAVKCIFVQVGLLIGRSGNSGRSAVLVWLPTPHVSSTSCTAVVNSRPTLYWICTGAHSSAKCRGQTKQDTEKVTTRHAVGTSGGISC